MDEEGAAASHVTSRMMTTDQVPCLSCFRVCYMQHRVPLGQLLGENKIPSA